jgi:serine/threonine-protein kinase
LQHEDERDEADWLLPEGTLICDRYLLKRAIGLGGMGAVYEAIDQHLERPVAVKFLSPTYACKSENIIRFEREALAVGRIGHPNICDVRDRDVTDEGIPFIVMELLEGMTLRELVALEGPLPPERLVPLVLQILSALSAAHRAGVVHRDLKADNIYLVDDGLGQDRVKLLDFGVSRFMAGTHAQRLTKSGMVVGTPLYVSPEQAVGRADVDHRTDLWSLGVVMYEALVGELPFSGKNPAQVLVQIVTEPVPNMRESCPSLPESLIHVVRKALSKDRSERYQDAQSFAEDLRQST